MRSEGEESERGGVLSFLLTALAAAFFLAILVLVSGGFFLYVIGVAGGVALLGLFHYLTWGMMLTNETAGDREEEDLLRRAAEDDPEYHRHFRE